MPRSPRAMARPWAVATPTMRRFAIRCSICAVANIGAMWRMLCSRGTDLRIESSNLVADAEGGSADWQAWYAFSATGRPVHNVVRSQFRFRDGRSSGRSIDSTSGAGRARPSARAGAAARLDAVPAPQGAHPMPTRRWPLHSESGEPAQLSRRRPRRYRADPSTLPRQPGRGHVGNFERSDRRTPAGLAEPTADAHRRSRCAD